MNTLLLSVMERRRELAVLRVVGASRRFIRSMVTLEGLSIATFGCLLGLVLGAVLQYVVTTGLSRAAAVQVPFHLISPALLLVPAAFLLTMLAPILPVRQAGRVNLVLALNE